MSSLMSSFLVIDGYQKGVITQDLNKKKILHRFVGEELFVWKEDKKRVIQYLNQSKIKYRVGW